MEYLIGILWLLGGAVAFAILCKRRGGIPKDYGEQTAGLIIAFVLSWIIVIIAAIVLLCRTLVKPAPDPNRDRTIKKEEWKAMQRDKRIRAKQQEEKKQEEY